MTMTSPIMLIIMAKICKTKHFSFESLPEESVEPIVDNKITKDTAQNKKSLI